MPGCLVVPLIDMPGLALADVFAKETSSSCCMSRHAYTLGQLMQQRQYLEHGGHASSCGNQGVGGSVELVLPALPNCYSS